MSRLHYVVNVENENKHSAKFRFHEKFRKFEKLE